MLRLYAALRAILDRLALISREATTSLAPLWVNPWFPPFDGASLYGLIAENRPARYIEVGSGISTRFARQAVRDLGLQTRIISIDPHPHNSVEGLCDEIIVSRMEDMPASFWAELSAGDMLFVDNSHRSFPASDVTVFFLEILPRLKPGVIVHVHDIYLPFDYIAGHLPRQWNEQYLLATALLFGAEKFEILFPAWFIGRDPELAAHGAAMLRQGSLADLDLYGASFWMRMV